VSVLGFLLGHRNHSLGRVGDEASPSFCDIRLRNGARVERMLSGERRSGQVYGGRP